MPINDTTPTSANDIASGAIDRFRNDAFCSTFDRSGR